MTVSLNPSPIARNRTNSVKFLYSYDGQILPRPTDGVLRYIGGHTRILSVDRSISFAELLVKFGELTGISMNLKCKLPKEDLDVLVSVKSDEELKNIIDEYDRVSEYSHEEMKIRAILFPVQSLKKFTTPSSPVKFFQSSRMAAKTTYTPSPPSSPVSFNCSPTQSTLPPTRMAPGRFHQSPPRAAEAAVSYPGGERKDTGRSRCCPHGSSRRQHFVLYSNSYCR